MIASGKISRIKNTKYHFYPAACDPAYPVKILVFFAFSLCFLCGNYCVCSLVGEEIPLTLELALKKDERVWGLMQRSSLPDNHGMLFYQPSGHIWMFNTLIDLSVAFLDSDGKIIALGELKSYPEMMDPHRPVNSVKDLWKYPAYDPVFQFFISKSHPVPKNSKYALEMNKEWFKRHGVKIGDQLVWDANSAKGYVKK